MKKKIIILIPSVFLALILIVFLAIYFLFHDAINVIGTIEKISEDKNLYTMDYNGDYGFEKFIEEGGASSAEELAVFLSNFISKGYYTMQLEESENGCSTISAVSLSGEYIFGRNFDWIDCTCMIVITTPVNGYQSISTVNLDFLGYSTDYQPDSLINSFLTLGAPFAPLDGMNEMGLCIADLVIEEAGETHQDTGKPDLTTTTAIRLILDYAATVDEAVGLLRQYDMHSDIGTMHHLAISDSSGRSVVIEYINDEMFVTETPIVTNFILTEGDSYGLGSESSKIRFQILQDIHESQSGNLNELEMKSALIAVNQGEGFDPQWNTQWSVVFNQSKGTAVYYHCEDYDIMYEFEIKSQW